MGRYRRILALVASNTDSVAVAQRAVQLSRFYGATFALATVIDSTPRLKSNRTPAFVADEMHQTRVGDMRCKLEQMMAEIGCDGGCEIIIGCGSEQDVVSELTSSWRPDLVLVGSRARYGLEQNNERTAYDVLTVQYSRPGLSGRMINALAAAL
ncbi:MAG: universal stress protein [Proteobacteria bacterium]|nr:universal stress protein [Pseudomonadota bacterium]